VVDHDRTLPIGGSRQGALLAVLLLEPGRAVSRSRLIDEIWGDDPPPTAVNALQFHVAALRRALGGPRPTGDRAEAVRLGEECLAAFRALDDRLGVATAHNGRPEAALLLQSVADLEWERLGSPP
jgi:DNA-binding SARP family transcriptional activator